MKVKLSLRLGGTLPDSHVQVTTSATVTVGAVADALAHSDRLAGRWPAGRALTLRLHAGGRSAVTVPVDSTLLESGIRSGATVELAFAEDGRAAAAQAVATLRVVSGPDAGAEFLLPEGVTLVGRSAANDIRLDDPLVSKSHARISVGTRVEIVDNGSSNGVRVGGVRVTRTELGDGDVAELGDTQITVRRDQRTHADASAPEVEFTRAPRVLARPVDTPVDLPDLPRPPQSTRFPWLALVAPVVMGAVLFAVTRQPLSLVFVALSPLLMISNYVDQRTQRKRAFRDDVVAFEAALATAEADLKTAQSEELTDRLALHPSVAECLESAREVGGVLWSRRPEHPEFLQIRLGLGSVEPMNRPVMPRPGGLPEFYDKAKEVFDRYARLHGAPVVADVRSVGGLGLCGPRLHLEGVARAVLAQLLTLHSPAETVIACLTSTTARASWDWLEWLPHASSPHAPLAGPHLSADPGTGRLLLNRIEELVEVRGKGAPPDHRGPLERNGRSDVPIVPSVVLLVDDPAVETSRLTRIAERGPDVGVFVVWVARERNGLPGACRTYLEIDPSGGVRVGKVREGLVIEAVAAETLSSDGAAAMARRLSAVVDAGAPVEDQSDLPRSVSVVSLLGHEACDDPAVVLGRWRENLSLVPRDGAAPLAREKHSDLRAVVGDAGADQFTLDLRLDGPHALVGGTTGAGKSEFLQAWVLGLAHAYSPDRVTFLFVDYKGGAAFASCLDLPHCVGMVTDLSPYLVRRALTSLRAELHHRERLLNSKGKKDLIELEKTGDPDCPPSLIIVVDEFAALVNEVPEFVDGVVDVAARGRSLGLHLILATQRPQGVIKDNLRANTNLRIALRMSDESESHDVLGETMAAHFPASIPGRAAAKTGPGRITQFQSAFPGARTPAVAEAPLIEVTDLDFGLGRAWKLPEPPRPPTDVAKDIDRVVGTVAGAAVLGRVPAPRKPWLDSLASIYNLARFSMRRDTQLVLGVLDDPAHQAQVTESFHPDEEGNILFVGTGGTGKSTALRSLAVAAAVTPAGGVAHVYGLDFGGGQLGSLEQLPNVGSIVSGDDDERVRRLMGRLGQIIEERSERYSAVGAASLGEYRALAQRPTEPRILLLLDGFTNFRSLSESSLAHTATYTQFQRILSDGRAVGVHVAMTADRPSAVPTSVLSAFRRRVVLRLADEDAYMAMGVPRDVLDVDSPPGRALQVGKPQELQLAVFLTEDQAAAANSSSAAQSAAILALAGEIGRHHQRPEAIQSLRSQISSLELPADVAGKPVLGIADTTLAPMGFDASGIMLVAGPAGSGRTNAMHWLARSVRLRHPDTPLVHLSARRTPLSALELWSGSGDNEAEVARILEELQPIAAQPSTQGSPLVGVFVEYLPEFIGTSVEQSLLSLLGACRRNGHLVVADGETPSWGSPWPLVMEVRNARTGLLLQPDQSDGDNLLRTPLPKVKRADLPPGRGYWVKAGRAEKVQLPLVEDWVDGPIDLAADRVHSGAHLGHTAEAPPTPETHALQEAQ